MKIQRIHVLQNEECRIEKENEGHLIVGPATVVVAHGDLVPHEEITMEQRFELVATAIQGLKRHHWGRITQHIDMMYSSMAADVKIDDPETLIERLMREFKS